MKHLARIALLVASALALALLLAEGFVRAFLPQNLVLLRSDVWVAHATYGWTTAPHLDVRLSAGESSIRFLTDANGARIGAHGPRFAELRILAIGDSFLQAIEVEYEETFAARLEEQLSSDLGRAVAVVNAGVAGFGPNQYRLQIEDALRAEHYDAAVVFLYLGNDIAGKRVKTFPPRAPTVRHDLRLPRSASRKEIVAAVLYPINDFLEERSHLYTLAKDRALLLRMKFGLTSIDMPAILDRRNLRADNWDVTASILAEMQRVAAEHGVKFAVVLLPSIHEVDATYVADYARFLGIDLGLYDMDQASREMRRRLEQNGIAVYDATPALRGAAASGEPRLYDRVTIHLSPAGHRVAANGAAALLRSLLEP